MTNNTNIIPFKRQKKQIETIVPPELNIALKQALEQYTEELKQEKLQKKRERRQQRLNSDVLAQDHTTDPIKDLRDIEKAKEYFLTQPTRYRTPSNIRNYALFVFGCNTARRISDILRLKISDIYNPQTHTIKSKIKLTEKKTGKFCTVFLNDTVREALLMYWKVLMKLIWTICFLNPVRAGLKI